MKGLKIEWDSEREDFEADRLQDGRLRWLRLFHGRNKFGLSGLLYTPFHPSASEKKPASQPASHPDIHESKETPLPDAASSPISQNVRSPRNDVVMTYPIRSSSLLFLFFRTNQSIQFRQSVRHFLPTSQSVQFRQSVRLFLRTNQSTQFRQSVRRPLLPPLKSTPFSTRSSLRKKKKNGHDSLSLCVTTSLSLTFDFFSSPVRSSPAQPSAASPRVSWIRILHKNARTRHDDDEEEEKEEEDVSRMIMLLAAPAATGCMRKELRIRSMSASFGIYPSTLWPFSAPELFVCRRINPHIPLCTE